MPEAISKLEEIAIAEGGRLVYMRSERELRALQSQGRKGLEQDQVSVPDAQAVIRTADGALREINVEIDGKYHGRMLSEKIGRLNKNKQATVWCATPEREAYLRPKLEACAYIELIIVEPES